MPHPLNRKVEGEAKDTGHGHGGGGESLTAVPMRRWEDWERSRLRKLKREEKRRRDMERNHPGGFFTGDGEFLAAPDTRSQYDGSDSFSVASSDDDHWGTQIGGYNEHSTAFPPPPAALMPQGYESAATLGGAELEAMLESGFDDGEKRTPPNSTYVPRYQLSDGSTAQLPNMTGNGYSPLARASSPGPNPMSPISPQQTQHGARPNERYGPLGPLDPSARF